MGNTTCNTMGSLQFIALLFLTFHLASGGHVWGHDKKPTMCPLVPKKPGLSGKFQCIDVKAPSLVDEALKTCWKEAIDVDFVCLKQPSNKRTGPPGYGLGPPGMGPPGMGPLGKGQPGRGPPGRGPPGRGPPGRGPPGSGGKQMRRQWKRRIQMMRRRMFKMLIFKHLLSNLHWWIFFTKDVSPPVFPMLVPELQRKVKDRFRSCFMQKTGIEFEDKINTEQLIEKIKLYKGDESNISLLVNLTEECSQNSTYQSEFSRCMTRNIAVTCIRNYIKLHYNGMKDAKTEAPDSEDGEEENTGDYQIPDKNEEDIENDQIENEIVSNDIVADDNSKDDDGKYSYGSDDKDSSKRKGRSVDDDDDNDDEEIKDEEGDDDEDEKDQMKGKMMKVWKEKIMGMTQHLRCEPCLNLKPSDELVSVFQGCWNTTVSTSYIGKIKNCIQPQEEMKEHIASKPMHHVMMKKEGMWMKLFTPWTTKTVLWTTLFMTEEMFKEKQSCIIGNLGLGTQDKIDKKGYTEMIKKHLIGDDKDKETLIEITNKCGASKPEVKVSFPKFSECTLSTLETVCET